MNNKVSIKIEKDIVDTGRVSKYQTYLDTLSAMEGGESFVVNDYRIVDAVRHDAYKKGYKVKFRTIAKEKYRVWKHLDNK
jgi:hypothetical protein|tara:strand:- start:2150 stop:2389 length:240 start_codon:yes stop_codon:yes gene_type:complete